MSGYSGFLLTFETENRMMTADYGSFPLIIIHKSRDVSNRNLVNFYISVVIHSKSISYKIHVASKKQIRNKTVFFDNSVFFSFHLISFFALGNI